MKRISLKERTKQILRNQRAARHLADVNCAAKMIEDGSSVTLIAIVLDRTEASVRLLLQEYELRND